MSAVYAETPVDEIESNFSGEGELGFIASSGKTNTRILNTKISGLYELSRWRQSGSLEIEKTETDGKSALDHNILNLKSDYAISQRSYAFIAARYEEDELRGFESKQSITLGLGRRIKSDNGMEFSIELGEGYRRTETIAGIIQNNAITRLSMAYTAKVTDATFFDQSIFIEAGSDNTISESNTAFRFNITEQMALKVSHKIKHNSDPPLTATSTKRTTGITLIYGFR